MGRFAKFCYVSGLCALSAAFLLTAGDVLYSSYTHAPYATEIGKLELAAGILMMVFMFFGVFMLAFAVGDVARSTKAWSGRAKAVVILALFVTSFFGGYVYYWVRGKRTPSSH